MTLETTLLLKTQDLTLYSQQGLSNEVHDLFIVDYSNTTDILERTDIKQYRATTSLHSILVRQGLVCKFPLLNIPTALA